MAIESNLAGVVRVAYEAVTGEFNRDAEHAARVYKSSNETMSDSAIKLELAQDRLRREIAKGPSASRAQQRALLQLRAAEREVRAETERGTTSQRAYGRELDTNVRRTGRFGSSLRGLRSGVALATGGLLGTTGLIYALSKIKTATDEAEVAEGKLEQTLRNQGISFERNRELIDRRLASISRMSAFDDEDLSESLARATVRTGDLTSALEAQVDIVNIARGRTISLEAATQLWLKASLNQAGQLRRLGIEVGKNTTAEQLLAQLRETYAGQAIQYARSNASAQERYNIQLEESAEVIGRALSPALADVTRRAADWLERQNRSGELQRRVNAAVETGGDVLRGFADGLRTVKNVAEPVVDALGGIENAARLAFVVGIVSRVRRAALSFGLLQTSSATTAAKGVRDAGVFGRAWDAATRPRNMLVTTTVTGGGTVVGGGRTRPAPAPRGGRLPIVPLPGAGAIITGALIVDALTGGKGSAFVAQGISGGAGVSVEALKQAARADKIGVQHLPQLRELIGTGGFSRADYNAVAGIIARRNARGGSFGPEEGGTGQSIRAENQRRARARRRTGAGGNRSTDGLSSLQRAQLRFDEAGLTETLSDDLREARRLEAIARGKANVEGLKGDKLFAARQELNAAVARRQGIEQQIADDEREADERDREKRRERAEKRRERLAKAAAAEREETRKFDEVAARQRAESAKSERFRRFGWGAAAAFAKPGPVRNTPPSKDANTITREELGGIFRDFLTGWGEMVDAYYPNIAGGTVSTTTLEHLTREQTSVLRDGLTRPRVGSRGLDEAAMLG